MTKNDKKWQKMTKNDKKLPKNYQKWRKMTKNYQKMTKITKITHLHFNEVGSEPIDDFQVGRKVSVRVEVVLGPIWWISFGRKLRTKFNEGQIPTIFKICPSAFWFNYI
jgi:hypothetical protein